MKLLRAWIVLSAIILVISLSVHVSTFLQIDPMESIPGVMLLHLAIFPPFIAAILYSKKTTRGQSNDLQNILNSAPVWMRTAFYAFFAYALINFVLFLILSRGGTPTKRDGKFLLTDHGRVVREISETEYHRQEAYIVRGFSGHWMLFSTAAMTILTGVAQRRKPTPRS